MADKDDIAGNVLLHRRDFLKGAALGAAGLVVSRETKRRCRGTADSANSGGRAADAARAGGGPLAWPGIA